MTTSDRTSKTFSGGPSLRHRTLGLIALGWTVAVGATAAWLLQERVADYREQTLATATVRLGGVKETLAISFRQLAALPLNIAHRPSVRRFLAAPAEAGASGPVVPSDVQQLLDGVGTDFGLPLALLVDLRGDIVASTTASQPARGRDARNVAARSYFAESIAQGSALQFLLGRSSRVPGLYFANRIEGDGQPVGVAVVKQEASTLSRLLTDADGSLVLVTDANGVAVLANRPEVLLQRLPNVGVPEAQANLVATYQSEPPLLPWQAVRSPAGGRAAITYEIDGVSHVAVSSGLRDAPFRAWVLAPLDDEPAIGRNVAAGSAFVWLTGGLLLWLSWRRLQLVEAARAARLELSQLAQTLPLTAFRYHHPAQGRPYFSFLGRGVEELLGLERAAIEADPSLPWRLAASADERPPTRPHEFMVHVGGEVTWVLADSAAQSEADGSTTYNGYWLDVSARRATQARLAALFEHSATGYLFFDPKQGITHCNPATLQLFGTDDASRLLGRIPWFPDLSPERQPDGRLSRDAAMAAMREHTGSRERVRLRAWRFQRVDGSVFDAEVSVVALEWQGTPQFCAVITDVTAEREVQAAMQRARDAAESASRTKSSFLANMSHELRTPMNAIIGMTHLALEDGLPPRQRDYIEKAHGSAKSLLQILNDILDVSKIEAGQLELERIDFELEAVLGEMSNVLGLKAEQKGIELLFSATPDLPRRLVGDPTRLRQVLVNLGDNAIKFTDGGNVTVGMELTRDDASGIELHGWVKDSGPGLAPEDVERLFQPFTQGDASTTRRFGGTGLGLVISRQLVERMGGRLWVESRQGAGATFHFSARFTASIPRAPARAWLAGELRGLRALVVDDNPAALEVLGRMLGAFHVQPDFADSGEAALARIAADPLAYDWILLDWKMPGMDGVACARAIRERFPQSRACILLVTAFAREDALRAGAGLPLAGVLDKPVTPSVLHDCLLDARRLDHQTAAPRAPQAAARRLTAADDDSADARRRLAGRRILLVEDHPLNRELATELLKRAGMHIDIAVDGSEALRQLAQGGPYDGVLMDCQMPVMDGYDATRALRADPRWRDLPVIAMTASALAEDRERALSSGMNDHITKPIHVETMLRTMATWIGRDSAAPAEAAPADAMVIDFDAGLARCVGNAALQRKMLAHFAATEADFATRVRRLLDAGDVASALRGAHDLKGLAGTLAAPALQAAAERLHDELADGAASPETLDEVAAEVARVVDRIARHLRPPGQAPQPH